MKKITTLLISFLLIGTAFGQTATIGTSLTSPGTTIEIPLTVTNWYNIEAITLRVKYHTDALQLIGCDVPEDMCYYDNNGVVGFAWCSLTPMNFYGEIITFHFVAMRTGEINFIPNLCEIIQNPYIPLNVKYTNGKIIVPVKLTMDKK